MRDGHIEKKKLLFIFFMAIIFHGILAWMGFVPYKAQNTDTGFSHILKRLSGAGDAEHYLYLAQYGYQRVGDKANLIVFYPLYPILTGIIGRILAGNYVFAGLLISHICTGIAAIYLYLLIHMEYGEERAQTGVLSFLLYPFMVFTMGIYTEGLFLMLTVMGLYFIRRHNWEAAGIVGFLAALTRAQGMLLFAPAVYEYIRCRTDKKVDYKTDRKSALFLAGMPLGFCVYLGLNRWIQGDFFSFIEHEAAAPWYQTTQWMNVNLAKDYNMAQDYGILAYIIYWVQIVLFFLAIAMLLYGMKKKVPTCLIVYGGIYTCFTYLSGWMISGGRYMMGCIPLYIIISAIENRMVRSFILCIMASFCVFYTILFMQGQAIM